MHILEKKCVKGVEWDSLIDACLQHEGISEVHPVHFTFELAVVRVGCDKQLHISAGLWHLCGWRFGLCLHHLLLGWT